MVVSMTRGLTESTVKVRLSDVGSMTLDPLRDVRPTSQVTSPYVNGMVSVKFQYAPSNTVVFRTGEPSLYSVTSASPSTNPRTSFTFS